MRGLTQAKLKELIHYDPATGIFTRLVALSNSVKVGDVMGNDNGTGYLQASVDGHLYCLHRLAFLYVTGAFPPEQGDHLNHISTDNRWANLRQVTHTENQRNRSLSPKNKSGFTGVSWYKPCKKWAAYIHVNSKQENLGYFHKKSDAIAARKAAEVKYGYHPNHGS